MADLAVFIPTRHRRERLEECIKSFQETTLGDVDLYFVVDDDDEDYEDLDLNTVIYVERGTLVTAINEAAVQLAGKYDALFLGADDLVFQTPGWDLLLMGTLKEMGGTGYVYPDDRRRYDVPEHPLISTDIVKELGWFAEPGLAHFYVDNVWAELGKRLSLIRFCPRAVIEHRHWQTADVPRDETYKTAEDTHGGTDAAEYEAWRKTRMSEQVARLRRAFNPDLEWVLSKVN